MHYAPRAAAVSWLWAVVAVLGPGGGTKALAADLAPEEVTTMDKVIVEATHLDNPPGLVGLFQRRNEWRYVSAPDYEVLSRCDTDQTLAAARHLSDSLLLDEDLVPPGHLATLATPMTFIMFDQQPSPALEALIPNTIDTSETFDFGIYHNGAGFTGGGTDCSDGDTHCAVQNRWGMAWAWAGGGVGRGPHPTGLLFKLSKCAPALPAWYQYGFIGPCGILRLAGGNNSMIMAAATWVTETETKHMLAETRRTGEAPVLPPVAQLFGPRAGRLADWPSPEWMAEAALFLRWGLYGEPAHRQAFATFVERSRRERATEALFRACFGFGYADLNARLSRYLAADGRQPVRVPYSAFPRWRPTTANQPPFQDLVTREATSAEVARILGDWERMEGVAKRESDPALSALFLRRAGRTLNKSYDDGERDPGFLAVLGLYDDDVGAGPAARRILGEAVAAGVARPAAYVALARLHLAEFRVHPATAGKLSSAQMAEVLRPLFAARKLDRLAAQGYAVIAQAWAHSGEKPSLANLAVLKEGIALYPLDTGLALESAQTCAQWGYAALAGELIGGGLQVAEGPELEKFLDLRTSLAKNGP